MRLVLPKLFDNALILAERLDEAFDRIAQAINGRLDRGNLKPGESFALNQYRERQSLFVLATSGTARIGVGSTYLVDKYALGVTPVPSTLVALAAYFGFYATDRSGQFGALFSKGSDALAEDLRTLWVPAAKDVTATVYRYPAGLGVSFAAGDLIQVERDTTGEAWNQGTGNVLDHAYFAAVFQADHVV